MWNLEANSYKIVIHDITTTFFPLHIPPSDLSTSRHRDGPNQVPLTTQLTTPPPRNLPLLNLRPLPPVKEHIDPIPHKRSTTPRRRRRREVQVRPPGLQQVLDAPLLRGEAPRAVPRDERQGPAVGRGEEDEVRREGSGGGLCALWEGLVCEGGAMVFCCDADGGVGREVEVRVWDIMLVP